MFRAMCIRAGVLAIIISAVLLPGLVHAQDYRLGPDDVLEITVYREDELYREVRISSNGSISFPLLGDVKAEGLTSSELEKTLEEKLTKYLKKPQVTVFIKEYSTISVTGQVKEPGSFPLRGELSVIEAIGLAKGFTKVAAQNSVKIMRMENGQKKTIMVRVADISKRGDKTRDVPLKRGDIIYVPESLF
jgi:polysaccharide export outer membrane protein